VIVEFRKWGNSLAVRIPTAFANAVRAREGKRVQLSVEGGALVLRPLAISKRKRRYTLDDVLAGMTRENVPPGVDWGLPRGFEI
jgi:antitoxin MazE